MADCCEKFTESKNMEEHVGFEQLDDGWAVNGCCGGGCYVVTTMRFCPYCGTKLPD